MREHVPHQRDPTYRTDIDGLRALAIIGVVAYHVRLPGISGGFVGVDVFFVISGYVITQLLARHLEATDRLSLADFYARRIRRLFPALALMLLVTVLLGYFLLSPTGPRQEFTKSSIASLLFVANYYFLNTTGGYFDAPAELKPLLNLWSLSVEEQFYAVWPLTLILISMFTASARRRVWILGAIALITVISFVYSSLLVRSNPSAAFFVAGSRAWELGIGAMLALSLPNPSPRKAFIGGVISSIGLAMIVGAYVWIHSATRFPGPGALLPVLGAAMVIGGNGLAPASTTARLLGARPMVAIGLVSYGWYLWHWPLLAFAHARNMMQPQLWSDCAWALLALLLAALSLRYVENPIRYGRWTGSRSNSDVLKIGGASVLGLGLIAAGVVTAEEHGPRTARERLAVSVANDRPSGQMKDCLILKENWSGQLAVGKCRHGDPGSPVAIAVWGDSHAMAWTPLIGELQHADHLPAFVQLTMTVCAPVSLPRDQIESGELARNCAEFRRQALDEILLLKEHGLKGVVLAARWATIRHIDLPHVKRWSPYRALRSLRHYLGLSPESDPHQLAADSSPHDPLADGLDATLSLLQRAGLRVLILLDPPRVRYPISECAYYSFARMSECGISRSEYEHFFGDVTRTIEDVARRYPSVRVVDPIDYFCSPEFCAAFADGRPMLWDDEHVAMSTAVALAPQVEPVLRWLLAAESIETSPQSLHARGLESVLPDNAVARSTSQVGPLAPFLLRRHHTVEVPPLRDRQHIVGDLVKHQT
jgi:peptidoglycan/LPS O-acetylase OafA/YrhL